MNKLFPIVLALLFFGCDDILNEKDIYGCTDNTACNFNSEANIFDNSCMYPADLFFDEACECENDPDNILEIDVCGICGGEGYLFDELFEDTWVLVYGLWSDQEWGAWDTANLNIQSYKIDNYDYILNISCNNFNIFWNNNSYLWEFYGTWEPHVAITDGDGINDWIDQYSYLDISFVDWYFDEVPESYLNYFYYSSNFEPWFIGYKLVGEDSLKIYYNNGDFSNTSYGVDTYYRNIN